MNQTAVPYLSTEQLLAATERFDPYVAEVCDRLAASVELTREFRRRIAELERTRPPLELPALEGAKVVQCLVADCAHVWSAALAEQMAMRKQGFRLIYTAKVALDDGQWKLLQVFAQNEENNNESKV